MHRFVFPWGLVAKRAFPEYRRMTSLPLLNGLCKTYEDELITDDKQYKASVTGITVSDLAQRRCRGRYFLCGPAPQKKATTKQVTMRKTSQQSDGSKCQIFLYIICSLHPKTRMENCHLAWGGWRKPEVWQEERTEHECNGGFILTSSLRPGLLPDFSATRRSAFLLKEPRYSEKTYAKATHTPMRVPPIQYPCILRNQWRLLLAHHAVLSFTEGRCSCGRMVRAKKSMQHNWKHHNKLYRATATLVIY